MDIELMMQERHDLLTRLQDSLQEGLIPCEIAEKEEESGPEILTVILDGMGEEGEKEGAVGEFFFLPAASEEDKVQFFRSVVTLTDTILPESLPALYEAVAKINFRLPCGSYSVDEEGGYLAYILTVPLPMGLSEDALYEQMNVCVGNAAIASDLFSDILLKIASGEEKGINAYAY